jgi:hypothetical protein
VKPDILSIVSLTCLDYPYFYSGIPFLWPFRTPRKFVDTQLRGKVIAEQQQIKMREKISANLILLFPFAINFCPLSSTS